MVMKWSDKFVRLVRVPLLTRGRIVFALAVAVIADGLQVLLGPLGWAFFDEIIDVIAMGVTTWTLGFHVLLLPTFVVEVIPLVDMLPTWTACVLAVAVLRGRGQRLTRPPPNLPSQLPDAS